MKAASLSLYLILGFILSTVVGTVSHEYGHIAVAECLGNDTQLHYASMNWDSKFRDSLDYYWTELDGDIPKVDSLNIQKRIVLLNDQSKEEAFWITLGGPLQTLLVSFLGLYYLYNIQKTISWNWRNWLALFAAFFSARFIFNFAGGVIDFINKGKWSFGGDEARISWHFGLETGVIPSVMMAIGAAICLVSVFYFMPKRYRMNFIISGLLGSVLGWILWMEILGPVLLP